jgi:pimeloyl-ACP methyl ester carboxylesterase
MPAFLLVPGAWLGGWCWRDVAAHLQGDGHAVTCATLTGLGERRHLLNRDISLDTHVSDVVELLNCQDLNDAILVGHSYGGAVITAAAERVANRIRCLVYLDAAVPRDGESNNDVIGLERALKLRMAAESRGDGWRVPPADYVVEGVAETKRPWIEERLAPHPLRTFDEPVRLRSRPAAALPRTFIRSSPESELYEKLITRACAAGWLCRELGGGHYSMFTEPASVASALAEVAA